MRKEVSLDEWRIYMDTIVEAEINHVPTSEVDPFSKEFFDDPYPAHEELREAGPIVWLPKYQVWAIPRYAEVRDILGDWKTYTSARGVGIHDFKKERPWRPRSFVLETDPPFHDRTKGVLARVLSPAVMKTLRERFQQEADDLI